MRHHCGLVCVYDTPYVRKGNVMKKRFKLFGIILAMLLLAVGCQKGNDIELEYDVNEHIKLGNYKGIEVTVEKLEVTDEDVEDFIEYYMSLNADEVEITDRAAKEGDTVNIDFEGFKDDVAFEGGSGTDFLTLGSNTFIDGFEEGLIGVTPGETVDLNLTFPEDYHSEELKGQAVVFKVTVNAIIEKVLPELTDEYVKENTDYDTVAAYKQGIREELELENQEEMKTSKINDVFTAIVEDTEINSYPDVLIDKYKSSRIEEVQYYATMYGMELEEFLGQFMGMTMEALEEQAQTYAENMAAQEMILQAIILKENLKLSDKEYKAGVERYYNELGLASEEELFQYVTEKEVRQNLLWEKAFEFIAEQAIEL